MTARHRPTPRPASVHDFGDSEDEPTPLPEPWHLTRDPHFPTGMMPRLLLAPHAGSTQTLWRLDPARSNAADSPLATTRMSAREIAAMFERPAPAAAPAPAEDTPRRRRESARPEALRTQVLPRVVIGRAALPAWWPYAALSCAAFVSGLLVGLVL